MSTVTSTRTINTPPAEVYHAFTNATALRLWFSDGSQINAKDQGNLWLTWNEGYTVRGKFTALVPNQKIAFTWEGTLEPAPTQVEVMLTPQGSGTCVTVAHSGIGSGDAWAQTAPQMQKEWDAALENLQSVLETGHDLRVQRRPMLGILVGMFSPQRAAELGIPVQQGVLLAGVVDGMGAQAAGLQANDLIVSLDDAPVTDFISFNNAISPHQGGDTVQVGFYRRAEKHNVSMTLTKRPIPDIPAPAELAQRWQKNHQELDAELDALFAGVTDEAAARKPAPAEWSAKEVLAHLIWTERNMHMWMWAMVAGDDSTPFPDNNPTSLIGTLAVYPTLAELITAMKREERTTIAIVAGLPADFTASKMRYTHLVRNWFQLHTHNRTHFEQIRAALRQPVAA